MKRADTHAATALQLPNSGSDLWQVSCHLASLHRRRPSDGGAAGWATQGESTGAAAPRARACRRQPQFLAARATSEQQLRRACLRQAGPGGSARCAQAGALCAPAASLKPETGDAAAWPGPPPTRPGPAQGPAGPRTGSGRLETTRLPEARRRASRSGPAAGGNRKRTHQRNRA